MSVTVQVQSLAGETLFGPCLLDTPTAASVLQLVPGTDHFDRLLQGDEVLAADALVQAMEGGRATVLLTLVRVNCKLVEEMEESLVDSLLQHGILRDNLPGFEGLCLLFPIYHHHDRFNDGLDEDGFNQDGSLFMFVPNGRLLAKTREEFVETAHDTSVHDRLPRYSYEIAEGHFTEQDESGNVQIKWSGWATKLELCAGDADAPWRAQLIDQAANKMPRFVPTKAGKINLPEFCANWLKTSKSLLARPKVPPKLDMPSVTTETLVRLGLNPEHLFFWNDDGTMTPR